MKIMKITQKRNIGATTVQCQVCAVAMVIRRRPKAAAVCEACKRFYLRHLDSGDKLTCDTGTYSCLDCENKLAVTSSGTTLRLLCSWCRFNRCRMLGVTFKYHKNNNSRGDNKSSFTEESSSASNASLTTLLSTHFTYTPSSFLNNIVPGIQVSKDTLQSVIEAAAEFTSNLNQAKLRWLAHVSVDNNSKNNMTWCSAMSCLDENLQHLKTFVNKLPGYSNIDLTDRCRLLANYYAKATLIGGYSYPYYSINTENQQQFIAENEIAQVWKELEAWNPNRIEYAFLHGFMFYKSDDPRILYRNAIAQAVHQLQALFLAYMEQQYDNNLLLIRDRVATMARLFTLVDQVVLQRHQAYQ